MDSRNSWALCNLKKALAERRKVADLTKTLASVSPDKSAVMFKISVHDEVALKSFMDGSNPVSKPIWDEVMISYEIFELSKVHLKLNSAQKE